MTQVLEHLAGSARRLAPVVAVLLVAVALAFEEIDRIGAQNPGLAGSTLSISAIVGPTGFLQVGAWRDWSTAGLTGEAADAARVLATPAWAILAHVAVDLLSIVLYAMLAAAALQRWVPVPRPDASPEVRQDAEGRRRWATVALCALVVADLLENRGLVAGAILLASHAAFPGWLEIAIAVATAAKWLAVLLFASIILREQRFWADLGNALRGWARAVYAQRLSAVVVIVIAALSLLPPWHELLEQLPDVVRSWSDSWTGATHFVLASLAVQALAIVSFLIGRKRAELYWATHIEGSGGAGTTRLYDRADGTSLDRRRWPRWRYLVWALPFVAVGAAAVAFGLGGLGDHVDQAPLTTFLIIVGSLVLLSLVFEFVLSKRPRALGRATRYNRRTDHSFVRRVAAAGDVLAVLVLVFGALGVARAYGSLVLVEFTTAEYSARTPLYAALVAAALVAAVAAALLPRHLALRTTTPTRARTARGIAGQLSREFDPRTSAPMTRVGRGLAIGIPIVSGVFLAAVGLAPMTVGGALGVVAVTVGVLGSITCLLALIILALRERRPLALFESIGFRSDPVIALVLVIPFVIGQLSGFAPLHAVDRTADTVHAAQRDGLEEEFRAWLERTEGCVATTSDGTEYRALVLVAAEGGGIRAATWTASVLAEMWASGECTAGSVFLSSGVSGGSVGLAVAATLDGRPTWNDTPNAEIPGEIAPEVTDSTDVERGPEYADRLVAELERMSDSSALAAAVVGLLASDPLAATTGVRSPTIESSRWRDRAALIEDSWRVSSPGLTAAWDPFPSAPTGLVVFNSADIRSGCRVVISQVDLGFGTWGSTTSTDRGLPRCDQGIAEPPLTLDLIDFYPEGCGFDADWATAAMLSARFPVVTPGGVVDLPTACPEASDVSAADRLHLVDGGYAENSGLGLIADIAPGLARIVGAHNSALEAGAPLVVPHVVYIQNSPGAFLATPPAANSPEFAVPVGGFGTRETQVATSSWIQRALASLGALCLPGPGECVQRAEALENGPDGLGVSDRVIIAAAGTRPSVTVPLGWGLSDATTRQLAAEVRRQAVSDCVIPEWSEYACLGRYLARFSSEPAR